MAHTNSSLKHGHAIADSSICVTASTDVSSLGVELRSLVSEVACLRDEQSRLHELVTTRLQTQLEYINREIFTLKSLLYHSGASPDTHAFNGQFSKHRIFEDLRTAFSFHAYVETGAHLGFTTQFLSHFGRPVYAVEIDPEFHRRASELLCREPEVHLVLGDSVEFLEHVTTDIIKTTDLVLFYLDAHWRETLPLREELKIIATRHPRSVVMIDDFRVEDDLGYGFDCYPNGQQITLDYLAEELQMHGWQVFFPLIRSTCDHMMTDILAPRGTAVSSCDSAIIGTLDGVPSLRRWCAKGCAKP